MTSFTTALIAELGKKTSVSWLGYAGAVHAAWHIWLDDALYVLSGNDEQPLPGIESVSRVEVTMRSKESGGRLLTWVGDASVIRPDDELWAPVTKALVSARLNLDDLGTATARWAEHSVVTRIVPTGEFLEEPGSLSSDAHRAVPATTPATTRGALPKVFHRRVKRRPKLS